MAQIGYRLAGVRFDTSTRSYMWQYLDPSVLRDSPIKSLWYLHAQPPLFNAFLWLAESVSPFGLGASAHVVFLALGLALTVGSALLARELGVPWPGAIAVGAVIGCNPVTILYQNWLYATLAVATTLVLTVFALARFERTSRPVSFGLFLLGCATLVYLRSVFHPLWFLVVAVLASWWAARRLGVARALAVAAVPVLLVAGLALKNLVVFGDPGTSSWLGMSLAKLTTYPQLFDDSHELDRLERQGVVDRVAFVNPFFPFRSYADAGVPTPPPRGVPAVDEQLKANGDTNMNYWGYLEASRRSLDNDLAFIRARPGQYLSQVGSAWEYFLASPSSFHPLDQNRDRIRGLDQAWRLVAYGERPASFDLGVQTLNGSSVGIVTILVLVVLFLGALAAIVGRPRRLRDLVRRPSIVFGLSTCLGFAVVVNATEVGENMRFRYEIEPLQMVLVVALVIGTVARYRRVSDGDPSVPAVGREALEPGERVRVDQ